MSRLFALTMLLCTTAAPAETLEELLADLDARAGAITSGRHRTTSTLTVSTPGFHQESTTISTTEWKVQGDRYYSRTDMRAESRSTVGEKTTHMESKSLMVVDGTYTWIQTEAQGEVTVSRNVQPGILSHPSRALAPYRTHFDITVLPDPIEVDGATCVVVELRLKPVEGMPPQGHIEMAFARDTGMLRRTLNFDADGKETGRTMITDVELGIEIDDARFAYTPPEDVVVDDLTGEMGRKPHGPRRTQGPPTEDE